MTDPFGGFTEEALAAYQKALAEQAGTDFAESDSYDFTAAPTALVVHVVRGPRVRPAKRPAVK